MKIQIISLVLLSIISTLSISAQPIAKSVNDLENLETNEALFINKPLKILLAEVGPQIKMVYAIGTEYPKIRLGLFIFRFIDETEYKKCQAKGKTPKSLMVFIKEPFEWDMMKRPIESRTKWLPSDLEKYGNLTVVQLDVYEKK